MKTNKGAAMIEFALVLPLLAILVFGIIEFGLIIYNKAMITNASREGARVGIVFFVNPATGNWEPISDDTITTTVNNYLSNYLITFGASTTATVAISRANNPDLDPPAISPGGKLTINVSYPYTFLVIPGFIKSIGPSITLSGVTAMRFE